MPAVVLLIIPWAVQDYKNMNICVVDNDHSTLSENLINKAISSGYFRLIDVLPSNTDALQVVEAGKADAILEIQPEFEYDLMKTGMAHVLISVNAINSTKGALCSQYLSSIVRDYTQDILTENGLQVAPKAPPVNIIPLSFFNPHVNYKMFVVPALMMILLTILIGFLSSSNIVSERESAKLEETPENSVRKSPIIFAKLIAYWVVGCLILGIVLALSAWVYGFVPVGSALTMFLYGSIYVLAITGMGLIISNFSSKSEYAQVTTAFCLLIMIILCGVFFTIDSMPQWLKVVTHFNPLYYFMEAMRAIYLKGSSLSDLLPQFFTLCGFAIILGGFAIIGYKKQQLNSIE